MKEPGEYSEVLPTLLENRFSIDRLTLLIYSPGFSMYEICDDAEGHQSKKKIDYFVNFLTDLIQKAKQKDIAAEEIHNSIETKLYAYHYRIYDIDIQFCTKMPRTKKQDDEQMIEVFGDERDKDRGYMYEFYSNDYNVRIEYNPNKADFSLLSEIVFFISSFYREWRTSEFIKVSRIDLAFDYPLPLNPALIHFANSRKYNVHGGKTGIETVYYGAQKSAYNLCVYDKKKEYDQKFNILYPGAHLWRIELRCHNTWFIQELPCIGFSVLPRIEIFSGGLASGDVDFDLILMCAQHWGIKTILNMYPDRTKARHLKRFRELSACPVEHPQDLYLKNFRSVWDRERDKILSTFGLNPVEFCSRALSDQKL